MVCRPDCGPASLLLHCKVRLTQTAGHGGVCRRCTSCFPNARTSDLLTPKREEDIITLPLFPSGWGLRRRRLVGAEKSGVPKIGMPGFMVSITGRWMEGLGTEVGGME